ncbi:hypothetical protein [Streptomyces hirsutus]|uniref:hypothetical protein n=1 Tax=Streptomyces hirsutus TaxID=35620 RepID=UPI0036748B39
MNHVTQPSSPEAREAELQGPSLQQAHALAGRIIDQLTTPPRDIELRREFHGEYSVAVFWSHDVSGVAALASWAGATWSLTRSETSIGVYAETRTRIDGVSVWAWTLLSRPEADEAQQLLTPPAAEAAAVQPVPLGESTLAQAPAVPSDTLALPVVTAGPDEEATLRCERCSDTDEQVRGSGRSWVPTPRAAALCSGCATPDELAALTYAPAPAAEQPGGDR